MGRHLDLCNQVASGLVFHGYRFHHSFNDSHLSTPGPHLLLLGQATKLRREPLLRHLLAGHSLLWVWPVHSIDGDSGAVGSLLEVVCGQF